MTGLYLVAEDVPGGDLRRLAPSLSGQCAGIGADAGRYVVDPGLLFGAVGPTPARTVQPRFLHEHNLWGAITGRLYESATLRQIKRERGDASDLEVFALLHRQGKLMDALPRLNGAFFVIFWDPDARSVIAVNDRFGLHPMYWARGEGRFCLASRVLGPVLAGCVPGRWDTSGVAQLLTVDDWLGDTTLVQGVSAYPRATMLSHHAGRLDWTRYWDYDYQPDRRRVPAETAVLLADVFSEAVARAGDASRPIGIPLSGGLDSRCLLAAASRFAAPIHTFTWGAAGSCERILARKAAQTFGAVHHDYDYNVQGVADLADETLRISEGAANLLDCHVLRHLHLLDTGPSLFLDGFEGDVVLGGSYLRRSFFEPAETEALAAHVFAWRNTLLTEDQLEWAMASAVPQGEALPSRQLTRLFEGTELLEPANRADRFFLENHARRSIIEGPMQLRARFQSAECFFDYDFIDTILSVPPEQRLEHRIYIAMMKAGFPKALNTRWARTLLRPGAPEAAAMAVKALLKAGRIMESRLGFPRVSAWLSPVDFALWLRGPLRAWAQDVCLGAFPLADDVLAPPFCRAVWEEHQAGHDRTRLLGVIATIRVFSTLLQDARVGRAPGMIEPVEVTRQARSGGVNDE